MGDKSSVSGPATEPSPSTSRSARTGPGALLRVGLLLTLLVAVLGTVRFARYDWLGLPMDRARPDRVIEVGPCVDMVGSYVTESGRTISPTVVDEQQYLSLVRYYRGVPREDLPAACLYEPFVGRPAAPWLAHPIPADEGVALALVNAAFLLGAVWVMLLALRRSGHDLRTIAVAGALFALSWNTLMFGTSLLIESGVLFVATVVWWAVVSRRHWLVGPVLFLGFPLKETTAVLVVVLALAVWQDALAGRLTRGAAAARLAVAVAGPVLAMVVFGPLFPAADASWESGPNLDALAKNVGDPISWITFAVAALPVAYPGLRWIRARVRAEGPRAVLLDPAVGGLVITGVMCAWAFVSADFSARFLWIGYPFAAALTAVALAERR